MPLVAVFVFSVSALGQNKKGDKTITVVDNPNKVVVTESPGKYLDIEISGKRDNKDYSYKKTVSLSETAGSVEKNKEWEFKVPFSKPSKKKSYSNGVDIGGLGFGLVSAVGAPQEMNVNMGASWEIMFDHIVRFDFHPNQVPTSFSVGFGLTWRNYRMNGFNRFVKEESFIKLDTYPDGADINHSRLKVFSLTMPLMWNQPICKNVDFSLGPVVNFNTHGSMKTVYKLNGAKVKESSSNIHQNPVTLDLMATLQFSEVGIYFKYSPTNVLNTDFGPKFTSLSAGITLFY
jgi:hypothetical protein